MRSGTFYISSNQIYWLAGLLEAEGSFIPGSPSAPRTPILSINMTDVDVIEAVTQLLRTTVMNSSVVGNRKAMYRTSLRGGSAVAVMTMIKPIMGQRRQQQIERAIACHTLKVAYPQRKYVLADDTEPEHDRYWLAGYMEGEASFSLHRQSSWGWRYAYTLLQINSTDHDIVQRVQNLWEMHYRTSVNIACYQPKCPGSKPQYHIAVKGTKAHIIMADLYPLLYSRRQAQVEHILTAKHGNIVRESSRSYICSSIQQP